MNTDFDQLVRDSMTWFTDGVDAPAGLAEQARRRCRRRRNARMGWLAAGTALASAAVAAVISGPVTTGPGHQAHSRNRAATQAQTTAVVISRVDRALARAAAGHPVAYTRQTTEGVRLFVAIPHGRPTAVHAGVTSTWSRGSLEHVEVATRGGALALGMETDTRSGRSVQTMISYPQRVWWRGTYDAPTTPQPTPACTLGAITRTPTQWASEVRKLLTCGAAVAGHQRVDGVDTIRLRLSSSYQRACAAANDSRRCQPQDVGWHGTLWADASTYRPVRLISHGHRYTFQIDFRWLPPTAANLAMLHQRIPPGFRHV